jgi:hypothetical protein
MPNKVGRPREAGSGRSIRRSREQEQAEQKQSGRRKRITRLLERLMQTAGRWPDAERERAFKAGLYHGLRYLIPVDPTQAGLLAIQADSVPSEEEVRQDAFSPDYKGITIDADAYDVYCAVFDILHGLESLSGTLTPHAVLAGYDIRRK